MESLITISLDYLLLEVIFCRSQNLKILVEKSTIIKISGIDKDLVGKVASEIKMLADRYIATTDSGESWLPLLPELLDLQTDVKHILNIPVCMERMKNALSMYTDIDIDELQDLMTKLAEGNLNNAIQTARSWFEDSVINPSE